MENKQLDQAYEKFKGVKLAILIPDDFPTEFKMFRRSLMKIYEGLLALQQELRYYKYFKNNEKEPKDNFKIQLFESNQFRLDDRRNDLVKSGMDWGATHFLLLDSDMLFPPDIFYMLFRHNLPIVGGLYFHKIPPYDPQIYTRSLTYDKKREFVRLNIYKPNSLINSGSYNRGGKEISGEIHATGAGCLLIQRKVFEALKHQPYFNYPQIYNPDGTRTNYGYGSEDLFFFDRIIDETDYKIYIDTLVKCDHIIQPLRTASEDNFIGYNYLKKILNDLI